MKSATSTDTDAAKVYRAAAALIAEGKCFRSCWAIDRVQEMHRPGTKSRLRQRYVRTMLGTEATCDLPWGSVTGGSCPVDNRVRVLLLCFMAAIAERP